MRGTRVTSAEWEGARGLNNAGTYLHVDVFFVRLWKGQVAWDAVLECGSFV